MTAILRKFIFNKLVKQQHRYEQRGYNNLEKLYKTIRPGDVVLVEGRSEMSRLIKLFSGSQWSHCAMYVGNVAFDYKSLWVEHMSSLYGLPHIFTMRKTAAF